MQVFILILVCFALIAALPHRRNIVKVVSSHANEKILNGNDAVIGQFPWQAALYFQKDELIWFCGGSIIGNDWIVTAGHCAHGAQSVTIFTGLVYLEGNAGTLSFASDIFVHEDYNAASLQNDIALIKLNRSITFDDFNSAIALPNEPIGSEVMVTISGWGGIPNITSILNYGWVETISNDECEKYYRGQITDGMVCAICVTNVYRAPCNGDSGSPMVDSLNADKPVLAGIVSFVSGKGCDDVGAPFGHTRTAFYRDWILGITGF